MTRLQTFRHEAVFYEGESGFLDVTAPFIADAVAADDPVLVVVSARKIDLLRERLDRGADRVQFADMADVGKNPARIIPVWHDFVEEHGGDGRTLRGIGEPVFPERTPDELDECHRHEALLNLAFGDGPPWWLVCPYDTRVLPAAVVDEARRTHPVVRDGHESIGSPHFHDDLERAALADLLPDPPAHAARLTVNGPGLHIVRAFVAERAASAGLDERRAADLVLAIDELVTNSIRYGGGAGVVSIWREGRVLVCDVRDAGQVANALVGRRRPSVHQLGGRGLWLVHQLCDLVQLRSTGEGTSVRVHMSLG